MRDVHRKKEVAFGCCGDRFGGLGCHPAFRSPWLCKDIKPAPGQYDVTLPPSKGLWNISWKRQVEGRVKPSKHFGVFDKSVQRIPKEDLGPANYMPPGCVEVALKKPYVPDAGFSKAERFKTVVSKTPGPGAHGYPHEPLEAKRRRGSSTVGVFQWSKDRLKTRIPSYSLPPGTYEAQDPLKKLLEDPLKHGPMSSTASRDLSSITGYFAPPKPMPTGLWPYKLISGTEALFSPNKRHVGVFSTAPRFRHYATEADEFLAQYLRKNKKATPLPSPADYFPKFPKKHKAVNSPPFLNSGPNRQVIRPNFEPGPGRYNGDVKRYVNAHTNVFKSKTPRSIAFA